jgi:Holliday junction resolvase RusA-like endonuclease
MKNDKPYDGKMFYSHGTLKKYLNGHKKIKNMRRKPKIGFIIPSINRYYGYRAMYIPSLKKACIQKFLFPESIAYIDFLKKLAKKCEVKLYNKEVKLHMYITLRYPDYRRVDVDNPKAVFDALKGILFHDDSQVHILTIEKKMGNDQHSVSIRWKEIK